MRPLVSRRLLLSALCHPDLGAWGHLSGWIPLGIRSARRVRSRWQIHSLRNGMRWSMKMGGLVPSHLSRVSHGSLRTCREKRRAFLSCQVCFLSDCQLLLVAWKVTCWTAIGYRFRKNDRNNWISAKEWNCMLLNNLGMNMVCSYVDNVGVSSQVYLLKVFNVIWPYRYKYKCIA